MLNKLFATIRLFSIETCIIIIKGNNDKNTININYYIEIKELMHFDNKLYCVY
jgi:hypothetical protein